MVRNDLLVAPALEKNGNDKHKIYLPYPDEWFPMNLRADEPLGTPLLNKVDGGSRLKYNCQISDQDGQIPYTCPIYIREGASDAYLEGIILSIDISFQELSFPRSKFGIMCLTLL